MKKVFVVSIYVSDEYESIDGVYLNKQLAEERKKEIDSQINGTDSDAEFYYFDGCSIEEHELKGGD